MTKQHDTNDQFPCEFPIKVVGYANDDFQIAVLTVIHKHFPDIAEDAIVERASAEGKYLSLTITVLAQDKKQIDQIYKELSINPYVIFVL